MANNIGFLVFMCIGISIGTYLIATGHVALGLQFAFSVCGGTFGLFMVRNTITH